MAKCNNRGGLRALAAAFPFTLPVLTGYLFIGIAFGVMYRAQGYDFWWAALMSLLVYAGSGQYLAVNFFVPGMSLVNVVMMTFMVNVRHVFYGLSLLEKFNGMGWRKLYMIFSLTDETYSLYYIAKPPDGVDEKQFLFYIALLDQIYWVAGSVIGGIAGELIPFSAKGVEFAMTALFIVIFTEQWVSAANRLPAIIGVFGSLVCLLLFGASSFILPSMIVIMTVILSCKKLIVNDERGEGDAGER